MTVRSIKPETSTELKEFYQRLSSKNAAPLWEVISEIVLSEPRPSCQPSLWRYDEMRPLLMESGGLTTIEASERRVLVLENPGLLGISQITQSLYAGLQLILPGEVARSHRHVGSALRLVIEGEGAYTAVDGERTKMRPGDFILTPSWKFHDHANTGDTPVVWMDGLDLPIVNFFDASFAEQYQQKTQPLSRAEGDALARYGSNLLPIECKAESLASPVVNYPYAQCRRALEELRRNGPIDRYHGVKMQYSNPVTGGYPMPTIAAFLQLLPAGYQGLTSRSTDSTAYCVVEGRGCTRIGAASFIWQPHDIFVVPSWHPVAHAAEAEAVLFSFSDRAAQKVLGLWREELLPSN